MTHDAPLLLLSGTSPIPLDLIVHQGVDLRLSQALRDVGMNAAELKAWRAAQNLSQPALAALLGIHEMTLSRWENGNRLIPPYLHLALETLARRKRHPTRNRAVE